MSRSSNGTDLHLTNLGFQDLAQLLLVEVLRRRVLLYSTSENSALSSQGGFCGGQVDYLGGVKIQGFHAGAAGMGHHSL
jgi:hypothetical protein